MAKPNEIIYIEHNEYVEGLLPSGESFFIDSEDYAFVSSNMWHLCEGYLRSTKHGLLHRYLQREQLGDRLQVDHINNNRLDNRKGNLRIVTHAENMQKKVKYTSNTSGHVGVKWNRARCKWQAQITRNGIRQHLGLFDTKAEAILARRKAE